MAVLPCAQHIARAPDLEITYRNLETGAKLGEFPNGLQPFFRHFRQRLTAPEGKISIGPTGRTSYPPSQLVQLRQTEPVGVFNDQCVDVGYIHAGLDDGGANQNVDLAVDDAAPDF